MAQIGFYHLTRTDILDALPQLLSRTLEGGHKATVWCSGKTMLDALDKQLWKITSPAWLPHGSAGIIRPDLQPIWLTTGTDAPNNARFLFLLENRTCTDITMFDRVFDLFDGHDEAALAAARTRWSEQKAAGHELAYWRQEERGWKRAR